MEQKEISRKVNDGGILGSLILEVVGKPKEYVDQTIDKILTKLKGEAKVTIVKTNKQETKELEGKIFSGFIEVEVVTETFQKFLDVCYEYGPTSIEIMEPQKYEMDTKSISGVLNDVVTRAHSSTAHLREALAKIDILDRNAINLMKRGVLVIVEKEPQEINYIAEKLGLAKDKAEEFLKMFEKEGLIKLENTKCSINR